MRARPIRVAGRAGALALAAILAPDMAAAQDSDFELWLDQSVTYELDSGTSVELETAQRLRSADAGREDTYYARFWVNQEVADGVTLAGAVERRINDPGDDETRLHQQVSLRRGIFRGRLRAEQRFVDDRGGRVGLRLRTRAGVEVPLDGEEARWAFFSNAELFLTLRGTSIGGDEGVTGLRTQVGASYEVSDAVSLSLGYLRQQDFQDGEDDRVGHAPLVGVELSF